MKTSTYKNSISGLFYGAICLLLIYIIVSETSQNILFPTIDKVFNSTIELFKDSIFWESLATTLFDVIISLILSLVLSFVLALFETKSKFINKFFSPFIIFIKSTPIAVLAIYLHLLLGNKTSVVFIAFASTFPVIYSSFITSINEMDKNIKKELALTDVNFIKKYILVYIPLIMPYVFSSLINSFGIGLKAAIMGGYLMYTKNSLGYLLYDYKTTLDTEKQIALVIFIIIFSLIIELISKYLLKKLKQKTY